MENKDQELEDLKNTVKQLTLTVEDLRLALQKRLQQDKRHTNALTFVQGRLVTLQRVTGICAGLVCLGVLFYINEDNLKDNPELANTLTNAAITLIAGAGSVTAVSTTFSSRAEEIEEVEEDS